MTREPLHEISPSGLPEKPLGIPSQDPRPEAQERISPEEAHDDSNSVYMGGGTMAGAAMGAAVGTVVAGPVGVLVGATVGAVAGALGSYAAVSATNPDNEYWEKNYASQPGYVDGYTYQDDYAPAYRLGYQGRERYQGKTWDEAENELLGDWEALKGSSRLTWEQARESGRAAWSRVDTSTPRKG